MNSDFKKSLQKLFARMRLLTILILVASVAFMIRIGDAVTNARELSGSAVAAEEAKKPVEAAKDAAAQPPADKLKSTEEVKKEAATKTDAAKVDTAKTDGAAADKLADKAAAEGAKGTDIQLPSTDGKVDKKWQDAADTDSEYPEIKKEMYQDLMKRRQELDDKEKQLLQREALVDASQKEIDHKYKELVGLRDEIQGLLKKQTEAEDARIDSLIKIYSGMKPKDAARIFNTLDMDVLLSIIGKMPESKSAPIIATMDPDPARALTTMLAEQRKLPGMPKE